jgi:predicted small secreted protein
MKLKHIILGLVLMCFSTLMACQKTMEGFGKDMEKNGETIQHKANES